MKRSILFVSLLASLAACSSGGGSSDPASGAAAATSPTPPSSSASDATPFTFPTAAGNATSDATVVGQSYGNTCYTSDAGACNAWSTSGTPAITAQGSGASSVTLATNATGENILTLDVTDPGGGGINHQFDLGNNATPNSNANGLPGKNGLPSNLYFVPDGAPDGEGNTYSLIYGGSAAGDTSLSYVTYGLWNAGSNGNGAYGAFASGTLTSTADMSSLASSNATASYSGNVVGQAAIGGNTYQVTGTNSETATFGGANPGVTGSMALNATPESGDGGAWISPTYTAKISGNGFTGTISAPAATTPASIIASPAMSGPISGNFYGPSAANIGGSFTMNDGGTNSVMGAFAGHQ